jgi:hypothetical protein
MASSREGSKQCGAFTGIDSAKLLHDSGEHSRAGLYAKRYYIKSFYFFFAFGALTSVLNDLSA